MNNPKISVLTSLYNCAQYIESYFHCIAALEYTSDLEILLLHNAPSEEESQIIQSYLPLYPFVQHHIIAEREGLYATWNRGIKLAKGEYIAVWNVDDIRLPSSFHQQSVALDANVNADITYGDFYYMYQYGIPSEDLVYNKDFKLYPKDFLRTHHIGCFPMWRKTIHDRIGYFDEQFKLVADFEFQIRAAINCTLVKCEGILGYYLEYAQNKLSSNQTLQKTEGNVIYLRYGIFDYLNWVYLRRVLKNYQLTSIYSNQKYHPLSLYFKNRSLFIIKRLPLIFLSILKQPRYMLSYVKHVILKK